MINEKIQNAVLNYVPKEVSSERLTEGKALVHVTAWQVLHSRVKWNGDTKDRLPEFVDATPQLGIQFEDEDGAIGWHRFQTLGYKRWDELTDEEQGSDKYAKVQFGETVYACKVTKAGLVRIPHPRRTADACSFIDQFMSVVGKSGIPVGEAMSQIQEEGIQFVVTLENDEYEGKDQLKVTRFEKAEAMVDVDEEFGS